MNNFYIKNTETGILTPISEISNFTDVDQYEVNTKYKCPEFRNEEATLEFNLAQDLDIFGNIFGIDMSKKPDAYIISFTKPVQNRKHKKKRINKKWAKRYGYHTETFYSKGWKLHASPDGTFEFLKSVT